MKIEKIGQTVRRPWKPNLKLVAGKNEWRSISKVRHDRIRLLRIASGVINIRHFGKKTHRVLPHHRQALIFRIL